ncbi:MAG: flippase activity-associated protein Agl23 [Planctomycetota bacterium]|jgi:uncharacterized protein (TIGR03663 family)
MKYLQKPCLLILAATIVAAALRLPRLEQRTMHGDEAVHADKFGVLLEKGDYRYDPSEYHGPTLNYLTLIPAWLGGADNLEEVSEFTLRIVPVFFGASLVVLLLLLVDGLGGPAAAVAAVLTTFSPAFVFYSRYYIQEMLLVCFTFGVIACGYRYTRSRNIKWALLTGMFLALCHATKETCIIAFGSMLLALLLTFLTERRRGGSASNTKKIVRPWHIIAALATAAIVSALFYSSFLTNPGGILDSVRSYTAYFDRASENNLHIHPWYYYLKMLIYSKYALGPVWTEAIIVILAVVGFIVAITRKGVAAVDFGLLRFIAFYTLIMAVVYSAVPYKTPWCLLGFLHGMILLAGVGAVTVTKLVPNVLPRLIVMCLLVGASLHLVWQAYLGSYRFYADTRNPYVYAHPVTDVVTIAQRIEQIAHVHPDGNNMHIQVICPGSDYWPLPWYLRSFPRVGWWNEVDEQTPAAPVIIASPSVGPAVKNKLDKLKNPYVPLFNLYKELRPQVELRGYVRKDLWDSYQQHQVQLLLSQTDR